MHSSLKPLLCSACLQQISACNIHMSVFSNILCHVYIISYSPSPLFVALGLDTACITRTVVQNICSRWQQEAQDITQDVTMTLDAETTTEDVHKIKSIGWLVFDQSQRLDLLIESNTLIRAFLGKILTAYICIIWTSYSGYHIISLNISTFSLARGKHHAAVEVFYIIPSDARELIVAQWEDQVHLTKTYFLCVTAYISLTGNTT